MGLPATAHAPAIRAFDPPNVSQRYGAQETVVVERHRKLIVTGGHTPRPWHYEPRPDAEGDHLSIEGVQ